MTEQLSCPTGTTGLVLIDLLNDFLAGDGKMNPAIAEQLKSQDLIAGLERLLAGAREAGVKVLYAPHGLDEHTFDDIKYIHPTFQGGLTNQVFWKDSHGADFYESLRPLEGETVLGRHRMYDSLHGHRPAGAAAGPGHREGGVRRPDVRDVHRRNRTPRP
ncbi:isochorismatase family protein [Streptomyces sp. NPDC020794]|uniref:isochorismatase family protein n=1 Tax=unclassified Streptomyces TaxID=2593676 RepID=UPI0036E00185